MSRIERSMAILRWAMVIAAGVLAAYSVAVYGFPDEAQSHADADARYYCPMHPQIRSHDPGTCPICHMQLEPIPAAHQDRGAGSATLPPGMSEVTVTIERQQQFGIATTAVTTRSLRAERRHPAVIEARPSARAEVRTRVPAFIERIVVDRIGVRVRRGQTLATAFSPEIARLGDELAVAGQLGPEYGGGVTQGTSEGLRRAGVDPASQSALPSDRRGRFAITAPRAGFLTRVGVPVGAYATPDVVLFELADLDTVIAVASVADDVPPNADLSARFVSELGQDFVATLDSTDPTLDPQTRTRRLRFTVENPESALLPGAIGTLVLANVGAATLVVPADAVLDDGTRKIVFVDHGEGRFEPREVTVGGRDGDVVGILSGVREGERVVTRGGFLLDSESRLAAATRTLDTDAGAPHAHGATP